MAASPSDTTTTLNPGTGGDAMGESKGYQMDMGSPSAGLSPVKHPRVVAVDDDGRPMEVPLTERTGRAILDQLVQLNARIAQGFNQI